MTGDDPRSKQQYMQGMPIDNHSIGHMSEQTVDNGFAHG